MLEKSNGWWDRDVDHEGQRIRADVRMAAHEIWLRARGQAESVLGDSAAAGELMELSVAQASRYLDREGIALDSQNHVGLLLVIFRRLLNRRYAKLKRLVPIGDLSEWLPDQTWGRQIDNRLDCEKIVALLSIRSRTILTLRAAGYDWVEIGKFFQGSAAAIKGSFWREIRQVRRRMVSKDHQANEGQ
jgi:hypothetical protein